MGGGDRVMHHAMPRRDAKSIVRALLCLSIMAGGLALRGVGLGLGLPAFVVKYGGSLLWGTMVFFLVAIVASRLTRRDDRGCHCCWR